VTDKKQVSLFSIPVIVAALGYFVDIYDLLLFSIIRINSLQDIGLVGDQLANEGMSVIGHQMLGLMIGGILWGILGDKRGRLSVLFGSILLYSVANIANGFVQTLEQYSWCRFIAGIGLAGELGAGITLVSELLPKNKRGIGTSLVAGIGLTGAVVAYYIAQVFDWRVCYFIGGGLGLLLLLMRVSVFESGMFKTMTQAHVSRGNFFYFFQSGRRFKKYLLAILIGLPTWYVIGILVSFSEQFAQAMSINGTGRAVMFAYCGIALGDVVIGFVSQALKSRKKALYIFYVLTMIGIAWYFSLHNQSTQQLYLVSAYLGFATGFWAIFVTMAAEQFGTNIRATSATTVPNMVRGALPLMTLLYKYLLPSQGVLKAGMYTGIVVMSIACLAAYFTEETFGKDLDYYE
jgi:putative MFS transporter